MHEYMYIAVDNAVSIWWAALRNAAANIWDAAPDHAAGACMIYTYVHT